MSEEEQRIAIAEACGRVKRPDGYWYPADSTYGSQGLPDYLHDLNAMQDVLLTLPDSDDFVAHLDQFIYEDTGRLVSKMDRVRATAKQLAKAYLTTIEKWKP
jgi:CHAD domain-containing protein